LKTKIVIMASLLLGAFVLCVQAENPESIAGDFTKAFFGGKVSLPIFNFLDSTIVSGDRDVSKAELIVQAKSLPDRLDRETMNAIESIQWKFEKIAGEPQGSLYLNGVFHSTDRFQDEDIVMKGTMTFDEKNREPLERIHLVGSVVIVIRSTNGQYKIIGFAADVR